MIFSMHCCCRQRYSNCRHLLTDLPRAWWSKPHSTKAVVRLQPYWFKAVRCGAGISWCAARNSDAYVRCSTTKGSQLKKPARLFRYRYLVCPTRLQPVKTCWYRRMSAAHVNWLICVTKNHAMHGLPKGVRPSSKMFSLRSRAVSPARLTC